jgi:hypothetical protein
MFVGSANARWALVSAALLALFVGCGKSSSKSNDTRDPTPDAGENGTGGTSVGGTNARGGTSGEGMAGSEDGGESPGGAPTGGRAGTSSGGTSSAGSSNGGASTSGAAGAAGAPSIRVPDGCEPGAQHVGGLFCSTEMWCDGSRSTVSCADMGSSLWLCSCSDATTRTDYEFPDASGVRTCEAAAKACADPDLLTGAETCTQMETTDATTCTREDVCERLQEIDGVTLRTRTRESASCSVCFESNVSCCYCPGDRTADYRLGDVDLTAGCDFLTELCKPDSTRPVGAKACDPLWDITYPDACQMAVACGEPVELGDGTGLTLWDRFQTMCLEEANEMRCACTDATGAGKLALDFGAAPSNFEHCSAMTAACAELETLTPTGTKACSSDVGVLPSSCSVDGECSQPATLAGVDVTIRTTVDVQCDLQSSDQWLCRCTRTGSTLEVEAEDSESACDQAVAACPTTSPNL